MPETAQLISRSCTTGWLDWVWGDLWLTDDALFRISRGLPATLAAASTHTRGRSTVPDDYTTPEALESELPGDRKNRHIQLSAIKRARFRPGRLNTRLSLTLDDGTRVTLLWLKDDPAYKILAARLGK